MENWGYYTADGVSDYLPELCFAKRELEQTLRTLFLQSAFREIETTGLEFYDAYTYGKKFAKQEELFKVQDERGRLLALRFDGTIPVARLAATVLKHEPRPLRLAYIGRMYRFGEHGGGRMKEFTQAGVELLGSRSPAADAEIISLAIESLKAVGLEAIQIAVGQIEFFRQMAVAWGLAKDAIEELSKLLDERNEVAVWGLLDAYNLAGADHEIVRLLLSSNGDWALLAELRSLCTNESARNVLDELSTISGLLEDWNLLSYCSLDLAQLSGMNYYTGLIFRAYTYGIGFPLCSGGRYDDVVSSFGMPTAATGFSLGVDLCLQALGRQGRLQPAAISIKRIMVPKRASRLAMPLAEKLRARGDLVELYWLEDGVGDAAVSDCTAMVPASWFEDPADSSYLLTEDGELQVINRKERTDAS